MWQLTNSGCVLRHLSRPLQRKDFHILEDIRQFARQYVEKSLASKKITMRAQCVSDLSCKHSYVIYLYQLETSMTLPSAQPLHCMPLRRYVTRYL